MVILGIWFEMVRLEMVSLITWLKVVKVFVLEIVD